MLRFSKAWIDLQSPVSPKFDNGGVTIVFSRPWQNVVSPIQIQFGVDIKPQPKPMLLGMELSVNWSAAQFIAQQMTLNEHVTNIGTHEASLWHGEVHRDNVTVSGHTGPAVQRCVNQPWMVKTTVMRCSSVRWSLPYSHRRDIVPAWFTGATLREQAGVSWRNRKVMRASVLQPFSQGSPRQQNHRFSWQGQATCNRHHVKWGFPAPRWICSDAYQPPEPGAIVISFNKPWQNNQSPVSLNFKQNPNYCYWDDGGGLIDAHPTLPPLDFNVPIEPQIRRSYLMTPQIACVRLSDNSSIVLRSISMQHSRNQWAPSCTLVFSSRGDAERAEGETIKVSINGYDFYFIVEELSSSRSFGNTSYGASGRGLLAELAAPYKKSINYVNQTDRSFMGLASDIVANTGWTVATSMTDFTVPAMAWSYSAKTPAEALNTMAVAIGAMLRVDAESRTINFVPKWPVSPWNTASSTPDVALHDGVILEHSERHEMRTMANAVLVRGEQIGVAVKVKRTGSAGDEFASDVLEKLITDPQAARMRGSHELAEVGDKKQTQLRTKLMVDLPPITPGMLVGVTVDGKTYKATCDAWQLNAQTNNQGQTVVNQSLTLLRNAL